MKSVGSETNDHILATGGVPPFITGAGELEYDYTYLADHPSLFLDIDRALLSQDFTHFGNDQSRNLKYNDKTAFQAYVTHIEKLFNLNTIHERTTNLCAIKPNKWRPSDTRKLNNLDAHITTLMKRAEKLCQTK
jgi:hypothetical protein